MAAPSVKTNHKKIHSRFDSSRASPLRQPTWRRTLDWIHFSLSLSLYVSRLYNSSFHFTNVLISSFCATDRSVMFSSPWQNRERNRSTSVGVGGFTEGWDIVFWRSLCPFSVRIKNDLFRIPKHAPQVFPPCNLANVRRRAAQCEKAFLQSTKTLGELVVLGSRF